MCPIVWVFLICLRGLTSVCVESDYIFLCQPLCLSVFTCLHLFMYVYLCLFIPALVCSKDTRYFMLSWCYSMLSLNIYYINVEMHYGESLTKDRKKLQ